MSKNEEVETFTEKLYRKCSAEPLVPIGTLVTVGFLYKGLRAFHANEGRKAQLLMRGRVIAQGFTVVAMCCGAFMGKK